MNQDSIHRILDGEGVPEALSPEDWKRYQAMDASARRVVEHLQSQPVPDLVTRVMSALPESSPVRREWGSRIRSAWQWVWLPRTLQVQVRPVLALGLVLLGLYVAPQRPPVEPSSVTPAAQGAETASTVYVQFRLDVPDASEVALAGTFTNWKPEYQLRPSGEGVWTVVVPMNPGVHDYTFIVDGERWVPDPHAPQVEDDFGGTNSRMALLTPEERA